MYENEKMIIFVTCLALSIAISKYVEGYLLKKRVQIKLFFIALIIILFTSLSLNYLATGLSMKPIKFLLTLQDKNIEGDWLNIVKLGNEDLIISYCSIEYKKNGVLFSGANFNRNGSERSGRFYTDFTSLNHPKLDYKYTWSEHDNKANKVEGLGELQFFDSKKLKGEFQNLNSSVKNIIISGTKLSEEEIGIWSSENRKKIIEEKIRDLGYK